MLFWLDGLKRSFSFASSIVHLSGFRRVRIRSHLGFADVFKLLVLDTLVLLDYFTMWNVSIRFETFVFTVQSVPPQSRSGLLKRAYGCCKYSFVPRITMQSMTKFCESSASVAVPTRCC